jgi:hypothetical protein
VEDVVNSLPSRASIHDPSVTEPTVHDIADALICLAGLVANNRVTQYPHVWIIKDVDWKRITDPILDALTNETSDLVQRGPTHIITRFKGTIFGINVIFCRGETVKST